MKIIEAQKIYLANRSVLVEQKKTLTSQRDKAKKMAELTGDSAYSDEAASLELTLKETEDKFLKNQDILDNLAEQHCNVANAEVNRQISDPETGLAAEYGKILEVARRIATGGKVPYKDEKKLMEYSDKLYQAAKSAAMLLKLRTGRNTILYGKMMIRKKILTRMRLRIIPRHQEIFLRYPLMFQQVAARIRQ